MQDITRLQKVRSQQSMPSEVSLDTMSYWNEENNDDFVILRTEAVKGSRVNILLKFVLGVMKWHTRDMKQVSLVQIQDLNLGICADIYVVYPEVEF